MEALIWCIEALSSTHIIGWIYFANNIVLMQIFPSHIWLQNTFVPTPILSLCTMPHVWILDFLEQQLPLLSCFLSKEIKTFGKAKQFPLEGWGENTRDFHLDFLSFSLRISTSYFLQFPLLCNQGGCSQSPQSGYSQLNVKIQIGKMKILGEMNK